MAKDVKIGSFVANAGHAAKGLLNNVVHAVDQNNDGKLDSEDLSIITVSVGNAVKKGTKVIKEGVDERARAHELKVLQPVFSESLSDNDFFIPKFIRVADRDKKHAESEACKGSIGFQSDTKELRIVNVFKDSVNEFGLSFYPDLDSNFYYVDPSDRNSYIALDEYFSYLKIARINELQKIAQDLGAKHFRVTYKEEQTSFSENKGKSHVKGGAKVVSCGGDAEVEHNSSEKKFSTVEIAAEMSFPGHEPIAPKLKYLQRDPSIQTLVAMRMDEHAPLMHQKYMLKLSNSSGIKESDAVKIDAALKEMKVSGNTTVASEARNESRRYLEYDIEF